VLIDNNLNFSNHTEGISMYKAHQCVSLSFCT